MNNSRTVSLRIVLCAISVCITFTPHSVYAETSGSDASEIEIMDYQFAGDGQTPTFLQYLDTQKFEMAKTKDLATATNKGDITYSVSLDLPPALFSPTVTLNYSSEGTMDLEMPYGWSLGGITEIRRPLVSYYELKEKDEWANAEWIVSGSSFSGTLKPSGENDNRFYLKAATSTTVIAEYHPGSNSWTVQSGGITYELSAADQGASTDFGTERWRVVTARDAVNNYITYCYDDGGRIEDIAYGGNTGTGADHLVTVAFAYGDNVVSRTNARAAFVKVFDKHIEKITIQSGWQGTCDQGASSSYSGTLGPSMASKPSDPKKSGTKTGSQKQTASSKGTVTTLTAVGFQDSDDDEDSDDRLYAYDLVTEEVDAINLLKRIEREGQTSATSEVLALFGYTTFDASDATTSSSSDVPESLGYSVTTVGTTGVTQTDTTKVLQDINRDGLPDVIDSSAEEAESTNRWQVTSQGVNHERRSFSWNSPEQVVSDGGTLGTSTLMAGNENGLPYNISYATRQVVDFDGDGYLDYLISGDLAGWTVFYGTGGKSDSLADADILGATEGKKGADDFVSFTEAPPTDAQETWTYAQASWRLNANIEGAESVTTDVQYGTLDFNGDGWLDLVHPSSQRVWLHSGVRGGGWNQELTITPALEAMRKVKYTLKQRQTTIQLDASEFCDALETAVLQGTEGDLGDATGFGTVTYTDASCSEAVNQVNSTETKSISYTDETGGFFDMNGDGLPDYVDAATSSWRVYLNTGHDLGIPGATPGYIYWSAPAPYTQRVDEGSPYIMWQDTLSSTEIDRDGKTAVVYQALLDIDGDGLLDLAMAEHENLTQKNVWYKNTGAGFEDSPRDLPAWYARTLNASISFSNVVNNAGNNTGSSATTSVQSTIDLNHDGVLDRVATQWTDEEGNAEGEETSSVTYGSYPPPYLLSTVENNQGGQTGIGYRSLATVSPSGDWSELQDTPNVKHLANVIETLDGITGASSRLVFEYDDGKFDRGIFAGFAGRSKTMSLDETIKGKTEYEYSLIEDLEPVITTQTQYDASSVSTGMGKGSSSNSFKRRFMIETTYKALSGDRSAFYLPSQRTITEYGGVSGSATSVIDFTWDEFGNLITYKHNGGGDPSLAIDVHYEYVADSANSFFRIAQQTISGTSGAVSQTTYYYDNHSGATETLTQGVLTQEDKSAGWTDGGEGLDDQRLSIQYGRGSRGEMTSVLDVATGEKIDQTFGFGGAVLETQTNALGHKLVRSIDERGRIASIKDNNGLMLLTTYDDFNREIKKEVTGTDGKTQTLKENEYTRSAWPYYSQQKLYNENGGVDVTSFAVEDGFGNVAQKWMQGDDGKYLVTTGFHNLQGLLTKTSHPREAGSAFQAPQGTLGVANPMTQTAYDVFGKTISHTKDATLGTGSQAYTYAQPRVESFTDEEGYQKRVTRDAHGRAIKVERGKSGTYSTLATYAYDPANNLVSFTDGEGVQYTYSYDGASRLRAVKWSALSGEDNWYENTYRGTRKTRMQDLSGGYTNWEYDAIGRLKTMTVSDSLPDSPTGITTYEYTYDDEWIGALTKTTDPSGTTEYTYDEFGRSANVSRSYLATDVSGTESLTAEFVYDYDLRGNIVSKVYPSGRALTMEYDYGFLKKTTSTTSGAEDYSISYDYNKWGLLEKALSSHGHSFTNTFTTPLWVDNIAMTFGGTTYSRTFTWHKNGLLQKYKIDSGVAENTGLGNNALPKTKTKITTMSLSGTLTQGMGATKATAKNTATASSAKSAGVSAGISAEVASANDVHYQYAYDNLKQVITLTKEALSTVNAQAVEEYTYNTSGSITSSTDHSGKEWTYTYDTGKNRIAGRTSSAGDSEEFVYDNAGRVKTWRSVNGTYTYYYDGQGRLRGMVEGASWKLVLDYDASGALVRRANNNPYTSSPDYVYSFDAWRYDGKTKQVTELDNNLVSMEGGAQKWVLNNYDGQAARVFGQTGSALSERVVGVFGTDLTQTGDAWDWSAYHGHEKQENLLHIGQRHLIQGFGQWLQPEPLLYQGLADGVLSEPLKMAAYRYSANAPTFYRDANGRNPAVIVAGGVAYAALDVAFVAADIAILTHSVRHGAGVGTIAIDLGCLAIDVALLANPVVPAVGGVAVHGVGATIHAAEGATHVALEVAHSAAMTGTSKGAGGIVSDGMEYAKAVATTDVSGGRYTPPSDATLAAFNQNDIRAGMRAQLQASEGAIGGEEASETSGAGLTYEDMPRSESGGISAEHSVLINREELEDQGYRFHSSPDTFK